MNLSTTHLLATDGARLAVRSWTPEGVPGLGDPQQQATSPRAVLQVVHGMAEHSGCYEGLARAMTERGIVVVADDHRGHGATASPADLGHTGDESAWAQLLEDQATVRAAVRQTWPGLPVYLLGHSWGSLIVRGVVASGVLKNAGGLDGLIVMGTAGDPGPAGALGYRLAQAQVRLQGPRHPSRLFDSMVFARSNRAFAPNRTTMDWLSRDEEAVDAYLADPLCGFVCTAAFFRDLFQAGNEVNEDRAFEAVPKTLPVLVVSGDQDPVGGAGKGVRGVATRLRRAGVREVSLRLYPGARHDVLHETNREQATADLCAWVEAHLVTSNRES